MFESISEPQNLPWLKHDYENTICTFTGCVALAPGYATYKSRKQLWFEVYPMIQLFVVFRFVLWLFNLLACCPQSFSMFFCFAGVFYCICSWIMFSSSRIWKSTTIVSLQCYFDDILFFIFKQIVLCFFHAMCFSFEILVTWSSSSWFSNHKHVHVIFFSWLVKILFCFAWFVEYYKYR